MKLKVDDFIEILGCSSNDVKVKKILDALKLQAPMLEKNKDTVWYEMDDTGYDLAFIDESLINNDEYADVGDGELIFVTVYFRKIDNIILPFGISKNDGYQTIIKKIGRIEERDHKLFNRKTWLDKRKNGLEYTLSFEFDDTYEKIERIILSYSYGQFSWVEELKK